MEYFLVLPLLLHQTYHQVLYELVVQLGYVFGTDSIDEVKIFNTALTVAQVQQQYNQTNYSSQFNNSVKMNGEVRCITIPNNAAINFGTGNFAVEFCINLQQITEWN